MHYLNLQRIEMKTPFIVCMSLLLLPGVAFSQMERKRTVTDRPVEDIFMTESIVGLSTITTLPKKNLSTSVRHNFGFISGGVEDFFGLDIGASVRLGINYGLTDKLNIGLGRSSLENNVDVSLKYLLTQQMRSGKVPVQVALKGGLGINTQREPRFDFTFSERLNYMASVLIARKFNDSFSLQLSPMVSHFNTVVIEEANTSSYHTLFGIGIAGRYKWNNSNALAFEYLPVVGNRNTGTTNHMALTYEIDTGGHVFQLFLMSGQWFTEQHLLARTNTHPEDWELRFGFNINRLFSL